MTERLPSLLSATRLAIAALFFGTFGVPSAGAQMPAQTCSVDQLNAAVDAAATELRTFSAEAQPKLKQQLAALKDKYKWPDESYEDRALEHLQDGKLSMLDTEANELLTRIDTLGRPEENPGQDTCAAVNEVKAAVSELLAVMRTKADYISLKVNAELGMAAAPQTVAIPSAAPQASASPAPPQQAPSAKPAEPSVVGTVAAAKPAAAPQTPAPPAEKLAKADPAPPKPQPQQSAAKPSLPPAPATQPQSAPPVPQSWQTTDNAALPPPQPPQPEPEPYPAAEGPYASVETGPYPAGSTAYGPVPDEPANGEGYTIEEIRDATKGFFGSISTSLASVIEHAFKKSGRPSAYILGQEGGGAFLAGLRYGEGTMYLRSGGTEKVYWHGPSIGSDFGADGSRTLFLVYRLNSPADLYRQFTGVDGTAYLVGGVGITYLKGGSVVMAPIRSGIGLRVGASLGYLRFTSHKTWNPF